MPKIVIIEKSGTLKTVSVKDFTEETLYKKAGLKTGEGFVLQHTWGVEDGLDQSIKLYAKKSGRAGQENKYDFPPPVDEVLFFGPCALVGSDLSTGKPVDLEEEDWEEIYEFLFGGFEDLGSDDSDDDEEDLDTDEELDVIQKTTGTVVKQTKQGYVKDGFIVDDDESEPESEESLLSEESEDTPPKKLLVKGRKPAAAKSTTSKSVPVAVQPQTQIEMNLQIEDCESELSEESYD